VARLPDKRRFTAAASSRVYDVIVLGSSLGGAFAAALLARRGFRVLWADEAATAAYSHHGFLWPSDIRPLPPPKAVPLLDDALTELGLTTQLSRMLRPVVPTLQLALPRHRLDLPVDDAQRLAECTREFGNAGAQLSRRVKELASAHSATDAFLRSPEALPPTALLARWRSRRAVVATPSLATPSPLSETEPAEHLLGQAPAFLVYQESPGPLAVHRSLGQLLAGAQRFPGGLGGLQELLTHRFQELGGTLLAHDALPGSSVQALSIEHGRPVGLEVRGSEATHRAPFLLSALDSPELWTLLPEGLRSGRGEALQTPAAGRAVLAVHWVLAEPALPRGLGELLLADDVGGVGTLLVQVGPARRADTRSDEPALRLVTGAAVFPADVAAERVRAHAVRLEEALERLLPFARTRALARSIPQLDAPAPRPGHLLHPLFARPAKPSWEALGVTATTPWPTLLRAGREVCPGLGLEGELLAALGALARVQRASQKRKPPGR
jgi:hypothetical protein